MTKEKSIGFITCYFGKLPWYFDYFVHSCNYNPSVDFFIVTDDKSYIKSIPGNVHLVYRTLNDINSIATERLGFSINILYAYKLCDFKPAYGLLFSELLESFDFWAFGDIDLIWGNIRNFMTNELLDAYDLISVRPDWIPGCFLLFRNNDLMNTLFTHSKDYKKVFSSNEHYCFDETNFAHDEFTDAHEATLEGNYHDNIPTEIESMMHVIKKMENAGHIKPYFDLFIIEGIPGKLKWENGTMTYRNRFEILLYHLIRFKKNYNPPTRREQIPDSFTISPAKIYHHKTSQMPVNEF